MSATPTSIEAWNRALESGQVARECCRVWLELVRWGAMTGPQLNDRLDTYSAHKRLRDLELMGAAEIVGVSEDGCQLWRALDKPPAEKAQRPRVRSRKEIIEENARLRDEIEKLQRQIKRQLSLFGEANQ